MTGTLKRLARFTRQASAARPTRCAVPGALAMPRPWLRLALVKQRVRDLVITGVFVLLGYAVLKVIQNSF